MVGQRHWANIKSTLGQRLVFAGQLFCVVCQITISTYIILMQHVQLG